MGSIAPFRAALAVEDDALLAADKVAQDLASAGSEGTVGFVYVTDRLKGTLETVVEHLCHRTGIKDWIGTKGLGVMAGKAAAFDKPAVAAMVGTWPKGQFALYDQVPLQNPLPFDPNAFGIVKAIVHCDPRNPKYDELLNTLASSSGAYLLGGLSASRTRHFEQVAGKVTEGGLSGLFLGPDVDVSIGVTQGCSALGPVREITEMDKNLITKLDNGPPLGALLGDLSAMGESDLRRVLQSLHVALPVANSDTGDYVVRNIMGIDTDKGYIAIAENVEPGRKLFFCQRDRAAATKDLSSMVQKLRARAGTINGALYVSCCGRGPSLFESAEEEVELVQKELGDVPMVGFYANGEIAGDRVYGYTGVLALF